MLNRNEVTKGVNVRTFTLTPETVELTTRHSEVFTVSGFGHGNFVKPTPGTFSRNKVDWLRGFVTYVPPASPVSNAVKRMRCQGLFASKSFKKPQDFVTPYNDALSDFNAQLRGTIDFSIDAFQAGQTVRMIRDTGKLVNLVKSFSPNQWAKRWLEYQYGWRPLIGTVYDAMDQLKRGLIDKPIILKAKGKTVSEWKDIYISSYAPVYGSKPVVLSNQESRILILGSYTRKDSWLNSLAGWTSLNPASIAWELMPFSFVADWFYNVGDYLRNFETALLYGNQLDWVFITETERYVSFEKLTDKGTSSNIASLNLEGGTEWIYKRRYQASKTLLPRAPRFEAKLGWQRMTSAAALLQATLLGRKTR